MADGTAEAGGRLDGIVLECPFPVLLHDGVDELEEHAVAWAVHHGVVSTTADRVLLERSRIGLMAGLIYPYGELDRVELITEWFIWGFAFDDRFIDGVHGLTDSVTTARRIPAYQQILDQPDADVDPSDPYAVSLQDICLRLASSASNEQIQRFIDGATSFLLGCACKAVLVGAQVVPSPAEYAAQRRHDIGLYSNFALIDYAGGFALPSSLWCDAHIRSLHAHVSCAVAYANDIYSHTKETGGEFHLPSVLAQQYGHAPTEALQHAARLYDEEITAVINLSARLSNRHGGSALLRHLSGLHHWVSGNDLWSRYTARYLPGGTTPRWA